MSLKSLYRRDEKTRLQDLYCLSFVESVDTLKAIDPDNAAVIRVFNEYECPGEHINEISHRAKVSPYTIRTLSRIKAINDNGGDVTQCIGRSRSQMQIANNQVIDMIEAGFSCSDIARKYGANDFTIWKQLQGLGYKYNNRLNRWEKVPSYKNILL